MPKATILRDQLTADQLSTLKSYHEGLTDQGEPVPYFKYLVGHPKQIRFDAKDGSFNIGGNSNTKFKQLVFQPIGWRIFTDNILNMGTKNWAEMFYVDDKNCVCAVLFHGYSVDNIFRLIEPLFYDEMTLADVVITVIPEKKENTKINPKGVYYIANFTYETGDAAKTAMLAEYAADQKLFRAETLTDIANIKTALNFFNPYIGAVMSGELGAYDPTGAAPDTLFIDQSGDQPAE